MPNSATRPAWSRKITTRSGLGAGRVFGNVDCHLWVVRHGRRQFRPGLWHRESSGTSLRLMACGAAAFWIRRSSPPSTTSATMRRSSTGLDYQPNGKDVFHLNLFAARNWIQIPNDLRPVGPGSAPARPDMEHRARLPAHVQRPHAVDRQSVHPEGPVELLRQPRSLRRHAGHAEPEPAAFELGREGGYCDHAGPQQLEIRR